MKRNSKLLAFVIAIAMVMSVLTLPTMTVGAASDTNLIGTITGVTDNVIQSSPVASLDGQTPAWQTNSATLAYNSTEKSISVTDREKSSSDGPQLLRLGLKSGKTYKISADFRRDSDVDTSGVLRARFYLTNPDAATNKASIFNSLNINTDTSRYMDGEVPDTSGENATLTTKGEWYTLSAIFTVGVNATGTEELGMNLAFKVGSNGNTPDFDYSIRNLEVVEIDNILAQMGFDYSFENGKTGDWESGAAETKTVVNAATEGITAKDGAKVLKITGASDQKDTLQRWNNIDGLLEEGKTYEASFYVKLASGTPSAEVQLTAFEAGTSKWKPAMSNSIGRMPASDWQKVSVQITRGDSRTDTNTSDGIDSRFHLVMKRAVGDTSSIYIDKWELKEVLPEMTVTTSGIEDGATGVATSASLIYDFSNKPYRMTNENITVTPAATAVVTPSAEDETIYTVALTGLKKETTYTVSLNNVVDENGQAATSSVTFTTTSDNAIFNFGKDGSFEADNEFQYFDTNAVTSHDSVTEQAFVGSSSQKLVVGAASTNYTARWQNVIADDTEGKVYAVSFYAKAGTGETNRVRAHVCETMLTTNTWKPADIACASKEINADGWTKVVGYFKVERYTDGAARENKGLHVGVTVTGNAGTVYIDKIELKELKALDDNSYLAAIETFGNTFDLEIATTAAEAKTVYLLAAKYDSEGAVADVKFAKTRVAPYVDGTTACAGSLAVEGIDDSYKLFIWDSNLKPLTAVLNSSQY
ncbi:MAG: carbohydrate binding domain-containing protein [Clostridia bacterium]|nr:carbohydrate binding domain-containing protein [Clostridia bacterium]